MNRILKSILSVLVVISLLCSLVPAANGLSELDSDSFICKSRLSKMQDGKTLVKAYERICECIEKRKEFVDISDLKLTISKLDLVSEAVRCDPNGYFWLDTSFSYRYSPSTNLTVQYIPDYNSLAGNSLSDLKKNIKKFDSAAEAIIRSAGIDSTTGEYKTELLLHDALALKTVYTEAENSHNEYGAIVDGKAVCQGYTLAFQYLLRLCNVKACSVVGYAGGPHSWNLVCIDGQTSPFAISLCRG